MLELVEVEDEIISFSFSSLSENEEGNRTLWTLILVELFLELGLLIPGSFFSLSVSLLSEYLRATPTVLRGNFGVFGEVLEVMVVALLALDFSRFFHFSNT